MSDKSIEAIVMLRAKVFAGAVRLEGERVEVSHEYQSVARRFITKGDAIEAGSPSAAAGADGKPARKSNKAVVAGDMATKSEQA